MLFVSPYPICPPTHGGGVFMYQTATELARLTQLHLIVLLDFEHQRASARRTGLAMRFGRVHRPHDRTRRTPSARSTRMPSPSSAIRDLEWLIHRQILLKNIDVLQLEYLPLGQYAGQFRQIPSILFEHDIYFQSIARQLPGMKAVARENVGYLRIPARAPLRIASAAEDGPRTSLQRAITSSILLSYLPQLEGKVDDDLRAGIDTARYEFRLDGREPDTMLFLGSFRHLPNQEGLEWFTRHVLPRILQQRPNARLVVIGSDPPQRHSLPGNTRCDRARRVC